MSSLIPSENPAPALTTEAFRRACGRFATGVAIVTTIDAAGVPHGLTINSFASVSLNPPLVLFSIDRGSQALPAFEAANFFVINFLDKTQRDLSHRFATRQDNRFTGVDWRPGDSAAPVLPQALGVLECRRHAVVDGGDHVIFIGHVQSAEAREGEPLLYFAGRYRFLGE